MNLSLFPSLRMLSVSLLLASVHSALWAQPDTALASRIAKIVSRPEFAHARFGMEFYAIDSNKVLYASNEQQLFVPGSTTKLLSVGTAMKLLGPDFRFKTKVHALGPVDKQGTLNGDLVLVASGDPNLSGRMQSDGTLAFKDEDHSYAPGPGAAVVEGNPLAAIDDLASQVAQRGIHRIKGRVLVDISLFPEGEHEGGTGIVISPICVNDNVVDVTASPGADTDTAPNFTFSPKTRYTRFVNQAKTVAKDAPFDLDFSDKTQADGTQVVTITGTVPLGMQPTLSVYRVASPSVFAQTVFSESLTAHSIVIAPAGSQLKPADFQGLKASYTEANVVAVHTSAPLSEEAKVTLKVSQNLHASMFAPYLIATYGAEPKGEAKKDPTTAGFGAEREMLSGAGLDLASAMQSDGAGADALFTPDFMVHYLTFLNRQSWAPQFRAALPIMGKDGTLVMIQKDAPAAGHVFAKTGTYGMPDHLNHGLMISGKGLAGYLVTPKGQVIAFAAYLNLYEGHGEKPSDALLKAGNVLGEIADAVYEGADSP